MYAHRKTNTAVRITENSDHNNTDNKNIADHDLSCPRISALRMYAMNSARTILILPSAFRYNAET